MTDPLDAASKSEQLFRDNAIKTARAIHSDSPKEDTSGVRYCLQCDEVIPLERIEAMPTAAYCVHCQSLME